MEIQIGDILTLGWLNKHYAKTRLLQHGSRWQVKEIAETVQFSGERGPWLLIRPCDGRDWRWINRNNDENFTIEKVEKV